MKRKLWIILALAALLALLCCGAAPADEGLTFTLQPAAGTLNTEYRQYPVHWITSFTPVRVELVDTDGMDSFVTSYEGERAQADMTKYYGTSLWGDTYVIRSYYHYDGYQSQNNKYVDSLPFELSLSNPALSFTLQPTVEALNTEYRQYPVHWTTGFKPVRVELVDTDGMDSFVTSYEGERAQADMTQNYGTGFWGDTYVIRAYYHYIGYQNKYNKYVDSQPFSLEIHTVTFDAGGGAGSMSSVDLVGDATYSLPECGFTWAGHVFDKWQIGDDFYQPGDTVVITEDTTVLAIWKQAFTITFSAGGGSGSMESMAAPADEEFTVPACGFTLPEGKVFSRWGVTGGIYYAPGDTIIPKYSMLLVAQWRSDRTSVGFNGNGGTGSMNPVELTPAQAAAYTLPECTYAPPTDCLFDQWQIIRRDSGETSCGLPGDVVSLSGCFNVTLKAVWAPKPCYEVSFNANGHGTAPLPQSVTEDRYAADPGPLTAEGYTFLGWYTEPGCTNRFDFTATRITGPITLYARWIDTITTIAINGFVFPEAGMRSVASAAITTGNTGYVCTGIEWRWPSANSTYGYAVSHEPMTFDPATAYTAVITLETVRGVLFDSSTVPESVTINGGTAGVDTARSGYVSETRYQLYTDPVTTENIIPIDEAHFPDAAFRTFLQGRNYDLNGDGCFSPSEIAAITNLSVPGRGIASLEGIGILSSLKVLNATGNALTVLDLSSSLLEEIYCSGNAGLAELRLPKSSHLKWLQCYGCALTGLDLRGVTYLAQAAAQTPTVSPNGQTKTYTCYVSGARIAEMIVDAELTLYDSYLHYARLSFDPGVGTGTMLSAMADKNVYYTLPSNAFTDPEDMYFTGWLLSGTGETYAAGETMDRLFAADENEVIFVAQWQSKTVLSITVPDATKTVSVGGFPVVLSYTGSGNLSGGYWLSSYDESAIADSVRASVLSPGTTYYAAILYPTSVSYTSLTRQIAQGTLVVKHAEIEDVVRYTVGSSVRSFLIVSVQPRTVDVSFNSGGGSGIMAPVTGKVPGTAYTLPACSFTAPPDMVFDRWSLGVPGTVITLNEDVTLVARWKAEDGAIPLTADFFPDDAFRNMIADNFDTNEGGYLTASEIAAAVGICTEDMDYSTVQGIEYLTELTTLILDSAPSLTGIDLSANTKLTHIEVFDNALEELNLEGLTQLTSLYCDGNALTSLDVSELGMTELVCYNNPMTSLILGSQPGLTRLSCYGSQLELLDLRGCPQLLDCVEHGTRNTAADYVEYKLDSTHVLRVDADTELIVPGMIAVDAANFPDASFRLWVSDNADGNANGWLSAEEIDATDEIYLNVPAYAGLSGTQGIEHFPGITELIISDTPGLTSLDLSGNTQINSLELIDTGLTGLILGNQPEMTSLLCYGNGLTVLDITGCPHLLNAYHSLPDTSRPEYDSYTSGDDELYVGKDTRIEAGDPAPTFTLPAALTTIEDAAFSGIAAEAVLIPAGVTGITGDPFSGSSVRCIYGTTELVRDFAQSYGYVFVPVRD